MCDTPIISVSGFSPEIHEMNTISRRRADLFRLAPNKGGRKNGRQRNANRDLRAAGSKLEEKLEEKLEKLEEKLEQKLDEKLEQKLEEKLEQKLEEKLEQKLEEKFDQKFDEKFDQRLDQKFDDKLKPLCDRLDRLEADMKYVRVVQLENNVIPRLNTIEVCYLDTAQRYMERTEQIDAMSADIDVLKAVVLDHSEKLSRISV